MGTRTTHLMVSVLFLFSCGKVEDSQRSDTNNYAALSSDSGQIEPSDRPIKKRKDCGEIILLNDRSLFFYCDVDKAGIHRVGQKKIRYTEVSMPESLYTRCPLCTVSTPPVWLLVWDGLLSFL